jgi:hypothetical protein
MPVKINALQIQRGPPSQDTGHEVQSDELAGSCRGPGQAGSLIPPRSTAVMSDSGTNQRDEHLRTIEKRADWLATAPRQLQTEPV